MALVSVLRQRKSEADLARLLAESLRESRCTEPFTEDDWIRVSSIGGLCPREEVLCSLHGMSRFNHVDASLGMIFQMGNAIHWMMQNRVLPTTGKIIGAWRCTWCGEIYGSVRTRLVPRPERCERCGAIAADAPRFNNRPEVGVHASAFIYMEEFVGDLQLKVGGHPDGYFVTGNPETYALEDVSVLEFKSASAKNFYKYREVPDFGHVIQVQTYLWLTGFRRAKIVYVNKGGWGKDILREHDLEYDEELIMRLKRMVMEIRAGLSSGEVPSNRICATRDCERANGCQVADHCFGIVR